MIIVDLWNSVVFSQDWFHFPVCLLFVLIALNRAVDI